MLVTEPSPRLSEIVAEAVAGGVDIVQLRDRVSAPDCLHEMATTLRPLTGCLLVNCVWPALASSVGADGVHLPEAGPDIALARREFGRPALVGRSVHTVDAARQAAAEGADYLIAGTIFASPSHPTLAPAGLNFLRQVCAAVSVPVLVIGGVTPENVAGCIAAGASGVAVLSPLMRADNPEETAKQYRAALDATWEKRT